MTIEIWHLISVPYHRFFDAQYNYSCREPFLLSIHIVVVVFLTTLHYLVNFKLNKWVGLHLFFRTLTYLVFLQMPVEKALSALWVFFQPLLFGLIGAEVSLEYLSGKLVGKLHF